MHERDIEGELDAALARYAAVEPRDGFGQRVLSNLREQPPVATRFSWARWVAAGLAAASLAALLILIGERHATVVNVKPVTVQDESAKATYHRKCKAHAQEASGTDQCRSGPEIGAVSCTGAANRTGEAVDPICTIRPSGCGSICGSEGQGAAARIG